MMAQNMSLSWKVFFLTISVIPTCIFADRFIKYLLAQGFTSVIILLALFIFLGTYLTIIIFTCKYSSSEVKITNWHFYAFSLFSITAVVGIGIALEENGYITGFISEYLRDGEPYIFSPFGAAVSYYDGIINYSLYFYMIYAISNNKSYRNVGLYWSGGLAFTMTALILGIFWGKYGWLPASWINILYLTVPVVIAWQLLQQRPTLETSKSSQLRLHQRPLDVILVILLSIAALISLLRGTAVLENNISVAKYYTDNIEPFLLMNDPSPFIKIQILLYLFYFLPIYVLSIYGLIVPGCSWFPDLTLLHAGAMAQGQFSAIATALHSGVPKQFQIPQTEEAQTVFWFVNLLLLVLPQLLLARCYVAGHFNRQSNSEITNCSTGKSKHN